MLAEQAPVAVELLLDAIVTKRHPPGGGVDGDDGLAQPALGLALAVAVLAALYLVVFPALEPILSVEDITLGP